MSTNPPDRQDPFAEGYAEGFVEGLAHQQEGLMRVEITPCTCWTVTGGAAIRNPQCEVHRAG